MLKTIIKLPDGIEISSGKIMGVAIQSCTITECVNSGEELTLGSTCAASLEATLLIDGGDLNIVAGDEVTVYKQDGDNAPVPAGVFILERPTRTTANTMKVTGYDRVSKLDKELSVWLSGLKEWPYSLTIFAGMVCKACGLNFKASSVPNGDFQVQQFTRSTVTGRQIMQWLGEICGRFCRATPGGDIEFAWYTDSGKTITTCGEPYYFQNSLSYENYQTAKVDTVHLRLANSNDGALWPDAEGVNSYIITGNPILSTKINEDLLPVLANIQAAVADVAYTPCKVSIPANMDIRAGNTVRIVDKNGKSITAYVMTKTQTGQKDTLECTGNRNRNTTTTANNKSAAERAAEANGYADASAKSAAQAAVDSQTQMQLFKKLTDDGNIHGLFMKDGQMYINTAYLAAGIIASADGTVKIDLANNFVTIDGERYGYKTQLKLSSSGLEGYGENSVGDMEHVLSFNLGVGGRPTGISNNAWMENVGLLIAAVSGTLTLGTSEASTEVYGDTVHIDSPIGNVKILGKSVSWKPIGDGTYTLIGQ